MFFPIRVLPRFKPITEIPIIEIAETTGKIEDDELVLGIAINGEARAYPLNVLNGPIREIFNDTLGGRAIAATWCFLCHNGIVYARDIDDRQLTLAVSGMLWHNSLVMVDEETGSLWSHLLGAAMQGPLDGKRLERLLAVMTDWKTWRTQHRETTLAVMSRMARRYRRTIYREPWRYVIGLTDGNEARAWRFDLLIEHAPINDRLGGLDVVVIFDARSNTALIYDRKVDSRTLNFKRQMDKLIDEQTGAEYDPLTGKPLNQSKNPTRLRRLPGVVSFVNAWQRFCPHTIFWEPDTAESVCLKRTFTSLTKYTYSHTDWCP
jgi:hypothetical protein